MGRISFDKYKTIIASDEGIDNEVLQILVFDENGKATSFKTGDVVRYHPDFCTEGERKYLFAITHINDHTMRCAITCLNDQLVLHGSELVGLNMITPVGTTVEEILESAKESEHV